MIDSMAAAPTTPTSTKIIGQLREASVNDANGILQIYSPYVRETVITFEYDVPTTETMQERIRQYSQLGFYVFEKDDEILGYAYASKHRDRAAYQWCCEVSVYVDSRYHGHGIATLLYRQLIQTLKSKGYIHAYAGITLPNTKSVAFHHGLGFKSIGIYPRIGFKMGGWYDVEWMGLELSTPPDNPLPFF